MEEIVIGMRRKRMLMIESPSLSILQGILIALWKKRDSRTSAQRHRSHAC